MLVKLENPDAYDFENELQNTVAGSVINIEDLSDGVFLIEMQQTNKDHLLELMQQWRAKEYVLSVSPIFIDEFGDEGGGYTNRVTVRLKSTDDYPVLQKCAEAYRITDIEPAPFDELNYILTIPHNTQKTALDIANELYETRLFKFAYPVCVLFVRLGGPNRNPDQWNEGSPFTVYPNPANDVLYINIAVDHPACEINIYSLQGGKALQTATNGNKTTIDVSVLPNGIYLLHLYNLSSGKREVRKIVIKH
jgi:hypothetical protein